MSKIAEQKALEAYPMNSEYIDLDDIGSFDESIPHREGYIKGYDQAMQDIEEFFYDRFNIHPHDCHVVQYVSDTPLEDIDGFIEQIKNYMKNESEN